MYGIIIDLQRKVSYQTDKSVYILIQSCVNDQVEHLKTLLYTYYI